MLRKLLRGLWFFVVIQIVYAQSVAGDVIAAVKKSWRGKDAA